MEVVKNLCQDGDRLSGEREPPHGKVSQERGGMYYVLYLVVLPPREPVVSTVKVSTKYLSLGNDEAHRPQVS